MQPLTAEEIRSSIVNASKGDARRMHLPATPEQLNWDDLDFLGWRDPKAPGRAYLIVPLGSTVVGLVLSATVPPRSLMRSNMCGFCHTFHDAASIALFSARLAGAAGRHGNTAGTYACTDLACPLYARNLRKPFLPQAAETVTVEERVARLRQKVTAFVERVLDTTASATAGGE
ncbi:FBP domain-containing protein [Catellatospora vulcania]|uniref:FBP domain-containing protein n=1 Tax=Catellatospora vulcania TaxID=1460450 RepID=UPI0012D39FB5|nr:FBP domain-containing protein [Catellatospora vulcania]